VYRSSSAQSASATIDMILTPQKVPKTLKHVHLIVRVAGRVFENKLEPDPLLEHTFAWDKTNIYNQKVYGIVDAEVSVGYEYTDCPGKDSNKNEFRAVGYFYF
jgi:hypothetical protein